MTRDETWVHHFELESKQASVEWRHATSPCLKKFKSQQSAGKVMVTVFWDSVGVILVDFMSKQATINSDVYIDRFKKVESKNTKSSNLLWKCLRFYCNMTTLGLTPASKPMRSSAPLAGEQFYIPHIFQTWHCLTSICLGPSKKV